MRSIVGLSGILAGLVVLIVIGLVVVGGDYYWLDPLERMDDARHDFLKPSGTWGHGIGIIATVVMMLNFWYPARKRIKSLRKVGKLSDWLTFHVFVGVTTPLVIAFHAAFQSNNLFATLTAFGLCVVVITGLIGRYFFSFLPTFQGRITSASAASERWRELLAATNEKMAAADDLAALEAITARYRSLPPGTFSIFAVIAQMALFTPSVRNQVASVKGAFWDSAIHEDFAHTFRALAKAWFRVAFHTQLRRLMGTWRSLHIILAVILVLLLSVHVALSLYLGFGWILFG